MGGRRSERLHERTRFLRSFVRSPRRVGAVLPTSRRAVRATLDLVALEDARCVVEMGAGTGPYTREIVKRLHRDARLIAFEIDPELAAGLERDYRDPRLQVANDSAERMGSYLGGRRADVVVSAIPFTSLPPRERESLLRAAQANLAEDGTLLVLQYSPFIQGQLEKIFASVERRVAPLNVPPAFLFACRGAE
jgi:phospholipid N-methyltransferase